MSTSGVNTAPVKIGLRERKKQQTRETIAKAALRLFAERGYDETTLSDIAEAADIAPRTIFAYFTSKEDIILCEESSIVSRLQAALDERPAGTTTVDALRGFLSSLQPQDEEGRLRKQILLASPALQMKMRGHHAEIEPLLAASIAKDLGAEPGDIRAILAAASVTAAFTSVRDRFLAADAATPMPHEQGMAILDEVLEFLRGGLDALRRRN